MQVKFHYIKHKNLLSFGNVETIVSIDTHKNTLITGKNGSGKSSLIIDGIFYCLFGKPYRKIAVAKLINSINKKNLVVEMGLTSNGSKYKIIRGQKPSIFQIYKDNALVEENASIGDYQKFIEEKILGHNQKTFRQIVCIGSASYKPFMELNAAERRAITEDVLDISIYSRMSEIAKTVYEEYKTKLHDISTEIEFTKNSIESTKNILLLAEKEEAERLQDNTEKIYELNESIKAIDANLVLVNDLIDSPDFLNINSKATTCNSIIQTLSNKLATEQYRLTKLQHDLSHIENNTVCESCGQHLPVEMLSEQKAGIQTSIHAIEVTILDIKNKLMLADEKYKKISEQQDEYQRLLYKKETLLSSLTTNKKQLAGLTLAKKSVTIQECQQRIVKMTDILVEKSDQKSVLLSEAAHYKCAIDMLKDDGIKSTVVQRFIPLMNQLINEYLSKFDLFIKFELDENFNERILSRNRDSFEYNSFSQGEKQKIDLAILMSWRKIAMMQSSLACNLLMFDETMDSSMDDSSVDVFVDILSSLEDEVNTFVISHRSATIPEVFDRHIIVKNVNNFSTLTEN